MKLMCMVYQRVKLQTLMAWCNTLGGAHSALGENQIYHVSYIITESYHTVHAKQCDMSCDCAPNQLVPSHYSIQLCM